MRHPQGRRRRLTGALRLATTGLGGFMMIGMVCLACTIWLATSGASFTSLTTNGANTYQSGSLTLSDDDSGSVMFSTLTSPADGYLTAGQTLTPRCINVTYTGTGTKPGYDEPFNDPSVLNSAQWWTPDLANTTVHDGIVDMIPSTASGQGNVVQSNGDKDMRNSQVQVEIVQTVGGGANTVLYAAAAQAQIYIVQNSSLIVFADMTSTWDSVQIPWDSGLIRFEGVVGV